MTVGKFPVAVQGGKQNKSRVRYEGSVDRKRTVDT